MNKTLLLNLLILLFSYITIIKRFISNRKYKFIFDMLATGFFILFIYDKNIPSLILLVLYRLIDRNLPLFQKKPNVFAFKSFFLFISTIMFIALNYGFGLINVLAFSYIIMDTLFTSNVSKIISKAILAYYTYLSKLYILTVYVIFSIFLLIVKMSNLGKK